MKEVLAISNQPSAMELWQGIGGHFDSLGQIVNEFLDNSVSNFSAHESATRNILVRLSEQSVGGDVIVTIEDTGTGMKDLDSAFTLGSQAAGKHLSMSMVLASNTRWHLQIRQITHGPFLLELPTIWLSVASKR